MGPHCPEGVHALKQCRKRDAAKCGRRRKVDHADQESVSLSVPQPSSHQRYPPSALASPVQPCCVSSLLCALCASVVQLFPPGHPTSSSSSSTTSASATSAATAARSTRRPNLDRLAKEGLRFTDAYAACPVCSPTRASIMTGKYPARLNITDWLPGRTDRPDQRLKRPDDPQRTAAGGSHARRGAQEARATPPATSASGTSAAKGFEPDEAGLRRQHRRRPHRHAAQLLRPVPRTSTARCRASRRPPTGEYLTDRLTAEAEKFIEANKDRPFFLYLPHYAVHTPLRAKQDVIDEVPGEADGPASRATRSTPRWSRAWTRPSAAC